ncbi:MAG: hypothetical protein KGZ39_00175 [Simkania sp.]|nr:hypothetical protein [Simkania sp.]
MTMSEKDEPKQKQPFEHLDSTLIVVGIKGWFILLFCLILSLIVVIWSFLGTIPLVAIGKGVIFDPTVGNSIEIVTETNKKKFLIYGFYPLGKAQTIHPGMEARLEFPGIESGIRGVVTEILPYPVSESDSYMQKIPSPSLREYFLEGSLPTFLVIITPLLDPSILLEESSNKNPLMAIQSGMVGRVRIILDHIRPVSYFLPNITEIPEKK